jgi:hypothetical protein
MRSSASLKGKEAANKVVWIMAATAVGFLLAGLLVKNESPRSTVRPKRALEFAAREYYDR